MSGSYDFSVYLEHMTMLRNALASVEQDLAAGPGGSGQAWAGLDPRSHELPQLVRANSEVARYVYGRLDEAGPVGIAHQIVADTLREWCGRVHELVDALTRAANGSAQRYRAADEDTWLNALRLMEAAGSFGTSGAGGAA